MPTLTSQPDGQAAVHRVSWTRKINNKTVTRTLTPEQTRRYQPWFDDARKLRQLTDELEALSLRLAQAAEGWGEK